MTVANTVLAAKPQAIIVNTTPVIEGYQNTLDGSKSKDKDGDALTYYWKQVKGLPVTIDNPRAAVTKFTNPLITKNDKPTKKHELVFELTVDDGKQGVDRKSVSAIVWPVNAYPVAVAGIDQIVTAEAAALGIGLDGSASSDDGMIIRYQWKLLSKLPKKARFRMNNAKSPAANFTYSNPDQVAPVTLKFELTVMDNDKVKRSANTSVTIFHKGGVLPPIANAGADQTVFSDTLVSLSSAQSTGSIESYHWLQTEGPEVILTGAEAVSANFSAPNVSTPTKLTFELTVENGSGSSKDDVTVNVKPLVPVANAGGDQTVISGSPVTLNGENSTGHISTYNWSQTAGPTVELTGSDKVQGFTAPEVKTTTVLSFKLTVVNSSGVSEDTIDVTVKPKIPVANAGADQTVFSGSVVRLDGSQSFGEIDSYVWTQTPGPTVVLEDAQTISASFTAPSVNSETVLSFKLTAGNVSGASEDTVRIIVKPAIPLANAGSDQTVEAAQTVNLSAHQSTGVIVSYSWSQTAGPSITLSGANTAEASFVAPNVSSNSTLSFKLIVTNSSGSTEDSVNIIVKPSVPVANAGNDQSVVSQASVNLSANLSSGFIESYSWSQVSGTIVSLSNPNSISPSFVAPSVVGSDVLVFKLIATNSTGSSEDTVSVLVSSAEIPPVANAGVDQTVTAGSTVNMNASLSQGTNNTYAWTQISGASVSMTGANDVSASFTAPEVNNLQELVFNLRASNSQGSSDDTITIRVTPRLPVANAGTDQTVIAGDSVVLDAGQSTGLIDSYLWSQSSGLPAVTITGANTVTAGFTAPNVQVSSVLTFKLAASNISGITEDTINIRINPRITGTLELSLGAQGNILNLSLENLQGGLPPYMVTLSWGDGHAEAPQTYPQSGPLSSGHTYETPGNMLTVTAAVADSNGLTKVFTRNISIAEVPCN